MVQIPPPFFVIRNSKHQTNYDSDDRGNSIDETGSSSSTKELPEDDQHNLPSSIPIVHLVESPSRGMYKLDFCDANDSFMAKFLAENEVADAEIDVASRAYYVDGRAWRHLEAYSELVGKPVNGNADEELKRKLCLNTTISHHEASFVHLEDALQDIVHTLLSMERLFNWQELVEARNQGNLQWKDIRAFLSLVRRNVPFVTHDGFLRRIVNTHLTFVQFVAFARLVEEHLESVSNVSPVDLPDVNIDFFPPFDSMAPEEQKVEILASVKDKAVRSAAHDSGLAIPASDLVSVDECDEEWQLYIQWWSTNADDVRNAFCMRELIFVEKNAEVRRNAEKDGVSMRGRHSQDPALREQFLRTFASWYLGIEGEEDSDADGAKLEEENVAKKPATFITYEFSSGQNGASPQTTTPGFRNKAWKPSSAVETCEKSRVENDDSHECCTLLPRFSLAGNTAEDSDFPEDSDCQSESDGGSNISSQASLAIDAPGAEDTPPQQSSGVCDEMALPLKQPSASDETKTPLSDETALPARISMSNIATTLIVGSKIKASAQRLKSSSFRSQFLRRLTTNIDTAAAMLHKKGGSKLRGIALFRSKVRLVIVLQKWLGKSSLQQVVEPENVDIFSYGDVAPPVMHTRPQSTPKQEDAEGRMRREELIRRAKAHHEHTLCSKIFKTMQSWRRQMLTEKQRQRELEQMMREREQLMHEKAMEAYKKSLTARFLLALRDQAARQKEERENEAAKKVDEMPAEQEVEEFSLVARPPSIERRYMAMEDRRSSKFRSQCRSLLDLNSSSLFEELNGMELVVGRNCRSGLDVICDDEYAQHFGDGIELRKENISPAPCGVSKAESGLMLDAATLQKMKCAKRAGGSNLFDVPQEFVGVPAPSSNGGLVDVEYRSREVARGVVVNQSI